MNNPKESQFEITMNGQTAMLQYRLEPGRIVFIHTEVPEDFEGQGIGSRLAKEGLEYARENGLKVVPRCPFIATYLKRHTEFADLLQ